MTPLLELLLMPEGVGQEWWEGEEKCSSGSATMTSKSLEEAIRCM